MKVDLGRRRQNAPLGATDFASAQPQPASGAGWLHHSPRIQRQQDAIQATFGPRTQAAPASVAALRPTTQRVELKDLATPKPITLDKELVEIQDKVMTRLNEAIGTLGTKAEAVYRLGRIDVEKPLEIGPIPKSLVELPDGFSFIKDDTELQSMICHVVQGTLDMTKQKSYIDEKGLADKDWQVIVDVDFYYERSASQVMFHKDTLGRTMFVNLNFNNDDEMEGPEIIANPPTIPQHEDLLKETLHPTFRADVQSTRNDMGPAKEISRTKVPKRGVVSFVDELVHHSTPLGGFREIPYVEMLKLIQQMGAVNGEIDSLKLSPTEQSELQAYRFVSLVEKGEKTTKVALEECALTVEQLNFLERNGCLVGDGGLDAKMASEKLASNDNYKAMKALKEKVLTSKSTRKDIFDRTKLHQFDDQLNDFLDPHIHQHGVPSMALANMAVGSEEKVVPGNYALPVLKRTKSRDLLKDPGSAIPSKGRRQFLRTWVQAIPRNKG